MTTVKYSQPSHQTVGDIRCPDSVRGNDIKLPAKAIGCKRLTAPSMLKVLDRACFVIFTSASVWDSPSNGLITLNRGKAAA
jgi:hypothetical protein